jgi:autotransporter-associated beta strand protein
MIKLPSALRSATGSVLVLSATLFLMLTPHRCDAQTLYWETPSGVWTTTPGNTNWSTSPGGITNTDWTDNANAVIEAANPTVTVGTGTIDVNNLTINNDMTLVGSGSGGGSNRVLRINGSSSGNITINGTTTDIAVVQVVLQGTSAYDGTLTAQPSESGRNDISLNSVTGSGITTKIDLVGGRLGLSSGLNGKTATIGELKGGSAGVVAGNFGTTGSTTKTLKIQQSSNTTFGGSMIDGGVGNRVLALIKDGTGRLRLTGCSLYVGSTTVAGGSLYMNGTSSGQGAYNVSAGATLGGTGSIGLAGSNVVTVASGGRLDPGDINDEGTTSVGTLVISGATSGVGLAFSGNASIDFALGTTSDMITLSGATMIGSAIGGAGSIVFNLTNVGAASSATYDLISFGGTTQGIALNTFALSSSSVEAGWTGAFSYGGDGNTLQFTVSAVPEPSLMAFLAFGLTFVLFRVRRKVAA